MRAHAMFFPEVCAVDREEWLPGNRRLRLGMLSSVWSPLRTSSVHVYKSPFVAAATGDGEGRSGHRYSLTHLREGSRAATCLLGMTRHP